MARGATITVPLDQASIDALALDPTSRTAVLAGPGATMDASVSGEEINVALPMNAAAGTWSLSLLGPTGEVLQTFDFQVAAVTATLEDATLGGNLAFAGSGFVPGSAVSWEIFDANGASAGSGTSAAGTGQDGALSEEAPLAMDNPGMLGQWKIVLTDTAGNTASAAAAIGFDDSKAAATVEYDKATDSMLVSVTGIRPGAWGSLAAVSGDIDLGATTDGLPGGIATAEGALKFSVPVNSQEFPKPPADATDILWTAAFKAQDNRGYDGSKIDLGTVKTDASLGQSEDRTQSPEFVDQDGKLVTWEEIVDPPVEPTNPPVDPTKPPVEPTNPPVEPTTPPVGPTNPPVVPTVPPVQPTKPAVPPVTDGGNPVPQPPVDKPGNEDPGNVPVNPPIQEPATPDQNEADRAKLEAEKERDRIETIFSDSNLQAGNGAVVLLGAELPRRSGFFLGDTVSNQEGNASTGQNDDSVTDPSESLETDEAADPTEDEIAQIAAPSAGSDTPSGGETIAVQAAGTTEAGPNLGPIALASVLGAAVLGGLAWLLLAWRRKRGHEEYQDDDGIPFQEAFMTEH